MLPSRAPEARPKRAKLGTPPTVTHAVGTTYLIRMWGFCAVRRVLRLSRALALRFLSLFTPPLPLAFFLGRVAELHLQTSQSLLIHLNPIHI